MLLDAFLEHIADVPLPLTFKSKVVENNTTINLDILLHHPLTKCNALFCNIWNHVFKTYPTRQDFQDFLRRVGATFDAIPDLSRALAEKMVQSWKILSLGYPVDIPQLTQFIDQTIAACQQEAFLLETIRKKWGHRFLVPYPQDKNLVDAFITMRNESLQLERELSLTYHVGKDVLTGYQVEHAPSTCDLWWTEKIQYTFYENTYMLMKLVSSVVVAVDDSVDEEDEYLKSALRYIVKHSKKRVLVFANSPISKHVKGVLQVPYHSALWNLIPKACPWFLHIGNEEMPTVSGIARSPQNNVFWSRMATPTNVPSTLLYDRCFTEDASQFDSSTRVYQLYNTSDFWKAHMSASCPFRTPSPNNHVLTFVDFLYGYKTKHKDAIQQLWSQDRQQCKYEIIIFDNRKNEMSVLACLLALINTNTSWGCTVYTNDESSSYYKQKLPEFVRIETLSTLEEPHFDIDVYNNALQDTDIWLSMKARGVEKVLIIQDDGMLLRPGVDAFLAYDYVGAPWSDTPGNEYIKVNIQPDLVGNGGFSLRTVDWMIRICKEHQRDIPQLFFHNINRIPEDVFFVKYLKKNGAKIAPKDVAMRFSAEQIAGVPCLGFHKVWVYHPHDVLLKFYASFL